MQSHNYSILKPDEGGMGQRHALYLLHSAGIQAKPAYSPYVGHTAVEVFGGKRIQNRAANILFNGHVRSLAKMSGLSRATVTAIAKEFGKRGK